MWKLSFTKDPNYDNVKSGNLILDNLKSEPTLNLLKKKLRKWKFYSCSCRMWKTYAPHADFINL